MTTRRALLASPGGRHGRGGMASLVRHLADALPRRLAGWQVDVLDTYGAGDGRPAFLRMPFHFLLAVLRVIGSRLAGRLDLVHIHMACYGSAVRKPVLASVARMLGIPTVMHLHGADFDAYCRALPAWRRRWLTGILKRCERVVVIGAHWRRFAVDELGLDAARVVLIHNGVPAQAMSSSRPQGGPVRLLMLGELGPRKGTPDLIEALARPALRGRDWLATLAGNGPVTAFRQQVATLGLSERIAIPGWQSADRVAALLAQSDILVLPSRQEGLPVAILEAMAGGVAVIATPVGAIPDAIAGGETGLLVPPGDVDALARAIATLIDDPARRARLARAARARFEAMFTIDRTADAVAALYREVTQRP
ncbi:MAG: glycosyltransferase family 4 protein [Alphaproteobacteria bacterium]|nr:glycosyltransferase family 4 protein [Alphaproteobacteria bacterium]